MKGNIGMEDNQPVTDDVSSEPIELTIRMTLKKKMINHLFCSLLRSVFFVLESKIWRRCNYTG